MYSSNIEGFRLRCTDPTDVHKHEYKILIAMPIQSASILLHLDACMSCTVKKTRPYEILHFASRDTDPKNRFRPVEMINGGP